MVLLLPMLENMWMASLPHTGERKVGRVEKKYPVFKENWEKEGRQREAWQEETNPGGSNKPREEEGLN